MFTTKQGNVTRYYDRNGTLKNYTIASVQHEMKTRGKRFYKNTIARTIITNIIKLALLLAIMAPAIAAYLVATA